MRYGYSSKKKCLSPSQGATCLFGSYGGRSCNLLTNAGVPLVTNSGDCLNYRHVSLSKKGVKVREF